MKRLRKGERETQAEIQGTGKMIRRRGNGAGNGEDREGELQGDKERTR